MRFPPSSEAPAACTPFRAPVALVFIAFVLQSQFSGAQSARFEIAEIRVTRVNVFDSRLPDENHWIERLVDALHMTTQESFIRDVLTLQSGQSVTSEEIEEAARVLRKFLFLRGVEIRKIPRDDGRVDLEVDTRDAWTTKLGGSFGGASGTTHFGFGAEEVNLLGLGKTVSINFDSTPERKTKKFAYLDPRLFGSVHTLETEYLDNSDGKGYRVKAERPLLRGADPYGWSVEGVDLTQTLRIYRNGGTSSKIDDHLRRLSAACLITLEGSAAQSLRLGVGWERLRERFEPVSLSAPVDLAPDRDRADVFGIFRFQELRFHSEAYVNKFSRVEDIPIGLDVEIRAGVSPKALAGSENVFLLGGRASQGIETTKESFGLTVATLDVRRGADGVEHSGRFLVDGTLFVRGPEKWPHDLIVFHARYGAGWGLAPQDRFLLGGTNGLRGYHSHAFDGDRILLLNFENRISGEHEFFRLVQIGAAAFLDSGIAADHRAWDAGRWSTSAGLGLRAAVSRSTHVNVLRLDVAYPFSRDSKGKRGIVVSFGSGQAF